MSESRWFRFWYLWLLVACAMQVVLGYTVALAIDTPLWAWHQGPMAESLWGTPAVPDAASGYRAYAMGMLGPTISSWAVALLFVVIVPFRRRQRWAWWCLATSVLAWFPVDTVISLREGIWINVLFNASGLTMIALPLAATFRQFHGRQARAM